MSALNRVVAQQEQSTRDVNHELTILVGVVGSQGQDIKVMKEDLATVKGDLSVVKSDLVAVKEELGTVRGDLGSVKTSVETHDRHFEALDTKLDQVLLMLSKLTSGLQ